MTRHHIAAGKRGVYRQRHQIGTDIPPNLATNAAGNTVYRAGPRDDPVWTLGRPRPHASTGPQTAPRGVRGGRQKEGRQKEGAADLGGALRGGLPPLPQLPVQQRLRPVAPAVAAQRLQLLQVVPLLQGQALGAGEQAAPWGTQTTVGVSRQRVT